MHPDPTSPAARRTKVARHRGVYYRELPGGKRRYEITFLDETGRRRWETVDGNLEAAQAVLEERNRHRRSGEAVAPRKMRLAEYADTWLAAQTQLRPRTRALYSGNLRIHVLPRLGWHHLHEIREDDITALIGALRERGLSGYTIRGVLVPLGRILNSAVRRGHIPSNPITRLERGERPAVERREMRILDSAEIGRVLEAADDAYRPAIATAVFTGLRLGELLGLTWADVDFDGGIVRVRRQLDRDGRRVAPKTPQAVREVVLMPSLGRLLHAQGAGVQSGAGQACRSGVRVSGGDAVALPEPLPAWSRRGA
ncbi:MAG: tyrosine-type recombinase/integrase [Actinobacteria bacterium]|nr:tyrosine-type recombinase/integrase [Actinomycetota bacterium]